MNSRGFTLVEVLVALAILSISITGISVMFNSYALIQRRSYLQLRVVQELHNRAEEIQACSPLTLHDSLWVADAKNFIVMQQHVLDSNALDSMAELYDWDENVLTDLYARPVEVRLFAFIQKGDEATGEMFDSDLIDEESLELIMNVTVIRE